MAHLPKVEELRNEELRNEEARPFVSQLPKSLAFSILRGQHRQGDMRGLAPVLRTTALCVALSVRAIRQDLGESQQVLQFSAEDEIMVAK